MRIPYFFFSRAQANYTLGVVAVIFDDNGCVLLVEHAYHPRFPWGLPGGWVGEDEAPQAAIQRELSEEIKLDARVIEVTHISKTAPNHVDMAFLCSIESPIGTLSHELLDYKWVDPDQLPEIRPFHRRSIELASKLLQRKDQWEPA